MAKHSGGPGTHSAGGVNSTMDAPFKTKGGMPSNGMKAPFEGGTSGIPLKMYDTLGGMASGAPGQVAPSEQGQKRGGTKEYPQGGGSMRDGKSNGRP